MTAAAKPWLRTKLSLIRAATLCVAPLLAWVLAWPGVAFAQAPAATQPGNGPIDVERAVADAFALDRRTVEGNGAQPARDEAARRLIARQTREGRDAILAILQLRQNQAAQLAAARAVPDDLNPDPRWIAPLGDLLGIAGAGGLERDLTVASIVALGSFHGTATDRTTAFGLVQRFVTNPANPPSKTSGIRALGACPDLPIADLLVSLVQNPQVRQIDRNAAADALAEMTLNSENGRDPRAWATWWVAQRGKNADQFRDELLDRQRRRHTGLNGDLIGPLRQMVQLAAPQNAGAALRVPLDSTEPALRSAGIHLVFETFNAQGQLPAGVLPRVRELVRDSDVDVRAEAARVLGSMNDHPSLEALLAQLTIEADAGARIAFMQAMASLRDVRAVPTLLLQLNDPSVRSATAAAETLAKLGEQIRADPALRDRVNGALLQTINNRGNQNPELKAACVEAMVPLRIPQNRQLLENLSGAQQTPRTRIAALAALGELRDPNLANVVFGVVQNEQREQHQPVRMAALDAMEKLNAGGFAQQLLELSRRPQEDPGVRDRARRVFEAYLHLASDQQLAAWSAQFLQNNELARRIPVLLEQLRGKDRPATKDPAEAARLQEAIGVAYMELNQPLMAIPFLRTALDYYQNNKGTPQAQASVRRPLLQCHLMAKQYTEAAKLAQEAMARDPATQQDVIPIIMREVERLIEGKQPRDAQRLIEEALKTPDLTRVFRDRLIRLRDTANQAPPERR